MHLLNRFFRDFFNSIIPKLLAFFKRLKTSHGISFAIIFIVLGQLINYFYPFNHFHVYQLLFVFAIILASWKIKEVLNGMDRFEQLTASSSINLIVVRIKKLIHSNWAIPGLIIISTLYIYSTIVLGYIELNIVGVYALILIVFVMITAILGQTLYVYYVILLYRLTNHNEFKYNFYFPARTEWVVHLTKLGRRLNNSFFILGFIYTLVYFINVPDGAINWTSNPVFNPLESIEIATSNNLIFVISWVTIFLIIIIAFPAYYLLQTSFIKLLIRKLKDISLNEIQDYMTVQRFKDKGEIDTELKYYNLMNSIETSASFPISNKNYIPLVSSICSIGVHILKISESLF